MRNMTDSEFLLAIVNPLLRYPERTLNTRVVDEMGVLLTLQVDKEDMGRLLGREGSTIKAIRTIMHVFGQIREARINIKLLEPEGSTYKREKSFDASISAMTNPNPRLSTLGVKDTDL